MLWGGVVGEGWRGLVVGRGKERGSGGGRWRGGGRRWRRGMHSGGVSDWRICLEGWDGVGILLRFSLPLYPAGRGAEYHHWWFEART